MTNDTFKDLIFKFIDLLDQVVILIIGLGVVFFLYGLLTYIFHSGNEAKRKDSVQYMTWGIIGLFVMVAFWGLVTLIAGIVGADAAVPFIN